MQFFIFVLLVCFLIFLFCLYLLANDDFVLLRKDVSLERVFNIAFLVAIFSLISSRVLFIVLNPSSNFLNPLVFFLFPYFPGLTLTGGLVGGIIAFFILVKRGKSPTARLFDFFSISFLCPMALGFLGYFLLSKSKFFSFHYISLIVVYLALFVVFLKILLPRLLNGQLKEGTIGIIFLISFSAISVLENFIGRIGKTFSFSIEDFILLFLFIVSLVFLVIQEKILEKVKKYWETRKA